MELTANFHLREVSLKVVGKKPSIVANEKLERGSGCTLGCGGTFELISGYKYHIFFGNKVCFAETEHDSCEESKASKRMKMDTMEPEMKCYQCGTLIICKYGSQYSSEKISAFDLDGTLIETASGRKFANDCTDWKLMSHVKNKLQELHETGYKIVILSNQGGIRRGKPTKEEFTRKVVSVAQSLSVPLLVLAAIGQDIYRKPCIGMWNYLLENENDQVVPNLSSNFYVGDAAGRLADWTKGM